MPFKVRLKSWLIALHLYLGLALCLFFAAWFVSGIAMMYYTTPILQPRERHATEAALPWGALKLEPAEAAKKAGWKDEPLKEARIAGLLGRPVLRARSASSLTAIWALSRPRLLRCAIWSMISISSAKRPIPAAPLPAARWSSSPSSPAAI